MTQFVLTQTYLLNRKESPLYLLPSIYLSVCLSIYMFTLFIQDRVSLFNPDFSRTHSVDQASLDHRDPPVSASLVLGLKTRTTTNFLFKIHFLKIYAGLWWYMLLTRRQRKVDL